MYQLRKKNLADIVAVYCRGRELFRPPTYCTSLIVRGSESELCAGRITV